MKASYVASTEIWPSDWRRRADALSARFARSPCIMMRSVSVHQIALYLARRTGSRPGRFGDKDLKGCPRHLKLLQAHFRSLFIFLACLHLNLSCSSAGPTAVLHIKMATTFRLPPLDAWQTISSTLSSAYSHFYRPVLGRKQVLPTER